MNAIKSFFGTLVNRYKTRRVANSFIIANTKIEKFEDTDHGRKVYDTFKDHENNCEPGTSIFVGCGISYSEQKLFIIEGLQNEDQMAIFIDNKLFFQGTQLGFDNTDVRKIGEDLLKQLGVSLGLLTAAPAKFL